MNCKIIRAQIDLQKSKVKDNIQGPWYQEVEAPTCLLSGGEGTLLSLLPEGPLSSK